MRLRSTLVALVAFAAMAVAEPGDASDLQLVSQRQVSERLTELTFRTPALTHLVSVRVLMPATVKAGHRYPVLYLLHGGGAGDRGVDDWTTPAGGGDAEGLTTDLPLITVMPSGGGSAWYADYYNNGLGGTPMWETFHIDQLIPWIDAHYPTIDSMHGRAIAGLSSGGFGAMSYASRNPDLFTAVAAFSGAVDTNTPWAVSPHFIDGLVAVQQDGPPGSLFGLWANEEVRWRGHNPWDLAENLRGDLIVLRTGNGEEGGEFGGGGPTDPAGGGLERAVHAQNESFHRRLDALGIEHVFGRNGPGTHNYEYWNDDLRETLPLFMERFASDPVPTTPFTLTAIEPAHGVYGWTVSIARTALEFSTLRDASSTGFTISGSGRATVTTAGYYEPGKVYEVVVRKTKRRVIADDEGRLRIAVLLGPSNMFQQRFLPNGTSPATQVYSASVRVFV